MKRIILAIITLAFLSWGFQSDSLGIPIMIISYGNKRSCIKRDTILDTVNIIRNLRESTVVGYYKKNSTIIEREVDYPKGLFLIIKR